MFAKNMSSTAQRREVVQQVIEQHEHSERRACALVGLNRRTFRRPVPQTSTTKYDCASWHRSGHRLARHACTSCYAGRGCSRTTSLRVLAVGQAWLIVSSVAICELDTFHQPEFLCAPDRLHTLFDAQLHKDVLQIRLDGFWRDADGACNLLV